MAEDVYSFGNWVRLRRQALVLSREDLARQVGVAEVSIRKIEADERRPSPQVAVLLAQQLQLAPETQALFVQVARGVLPVDQLPPPIPGATAPSPAAPATPTRTPALLPSGTITFLFTDIAGSTQLWEQHPEAMPAALARHDAILREAVAAHGGVVFKTVGDAVYAAFAGAPAALAATLEAQRVLQKEEWGAVGPLRVRMALHTGVAQERDGDYFGPPLNRLARLLAAGYGGQVLLSRVTWELVADHLPADVELRDRGVHLLKDLSRPEQIFQLAAPDLPSDFPPLTTLDPRRTNLPAQPTALIGREREVADVTALLRRADVRLVTLSGPGGTGKTRLGFQVTAELLDDFVDGAYFVDLAPISDPALVASTIAQTLGMKESSGQPLAERLKEYLREKRLLLLLDNFEQVLSAAPVVAGLLAAAPRLKFLVTSREMLHLRGEKEFPVPPLELPDPQHPKQIETLSQYAAVQLFIARALDAKPDFVVTNQNAPALAEVCARLDGLPLTIELAAARIKLFSPEALLARLNSRLAVLTGGLRDLPERQQTLRNTIEWSYNLLDAGEQTLFRRLSVFVGGCTGDAVEAVCNPDGDLPLEVIDGLAALLDKSMLKQREGRDGTPRFMMLETIHEYALEQLEQHGETESARRRHADWFLTLAETAAPKLEGAGSLLWRQQLETEHDNLRAALAWSHSAPDGAEIELRLVGALGDFWFHSGALSEARVWIERGLARRHTASPLVQAKLFREATGLAFHETDNARAMVFEEQALHLWRQFGDRLQVADSLRSIGTLARNLGDLDRSRVAVEEALQLFREAGASQKVAGALLAQGDIAFDLGDYTRATALFQEGLAIARQHGNLELTALALQTLARVARAEGDYARAVALYEESLAGFAASDVYRAVILWELGMATIDQGNYARAGALFRALMVEYKEARWTLPAGLEGMGAIAAAQGEGERAARLWGAASAAREASGLPMDVVDIKEYNRWISAARARFDANTFGAAWAEGRAMTLEQAIAFALSEGD